MPPDTDIPGLIEELRASAAFWKLKRVSFTSDQFERAANALAAKEHELAEARRNEARYLWLRSCPHDGWLAPGIGQTKLKQGEKLDAAIDAAIEQEGKRA